MGLKDWFWQKCYANTGNIECVLNCIVYGKYIVKNPVSKRLVAAMLKKIKGRVYEATTDLERIKLVSQYFSEAQLVELLETIDLSMKKNEDTAECFQQKSIKYFAKLNFEMAIRCCNLAMVFTPSDSTFLSDLHFDRAMILHYLDESEPVSMDVDKALSMGEELIDELKAELVRIKDKSVHLQSMKQNQEDSEMEKRRAAYSEYILFNVFRDPNANVESPEKNVKIVQDPVKGRTLVATGEFPPGTTLIVEDPFVTVMTEAMKWELKHCAKCYKRTRALIPCPNCIHTTYCSDECRLSDYEFLHKYECPCLNFFHAIHLPSNLQLGFRAVCQTGPEFLYKFFKELNDDVNLKEKIKVESPETGDKDWEYRQIYNLVSHPAREHLELHTWYSVGLVKVLDMKTSFFGQIDENDKPEFMEFIASCFLRHSQSFPFNSMTLWAHEKLKRKPKKSEKDKDNYGGVGMIGVFILSSLICHSCDPSAIRVNQMNGKLAIISSRRIMRGDEITISYGFDFSHGELEYRREQLEKCFRFKCDCLACIQKWPTEDKVDPSIRYLCPECSRLSTYEDTIKTGSCALSELIENEKGICRECNEEYFYFPLRANIKNYENILKSARQLLVDDKLVEVIPRLLDCIEFFQFHVLGPYVPLVQAQVYLQSAYEGIAENYSLYELNEQNAQ